MDPTRTDVDVEHEIARCLLLSDPGPNVLVFVIRGYERFTDEEAGAYAKLRKLFASHLNNYIIVVYTQGDKLKKHNTTIEEGLRKAGELVDKPGAKADAPDP
jgi:hypothetical protein